MMVVVLLKIQFSWAAVPLSSGSSINGYTVRMLSAWVVVYRHSPRDLAHAHLSHSYRDRLLVCVCVCVCVCVNIRSRQKRMVRRLDHNICVSYVRSVPHFVPCSLKSL